MWKRKPKTPTPSPPPVKCIHTWRDFDWYMEYDYRPQSKQVTIEIFEPYVCIHCHTRKDVKLHRSVHGCNSAKQAQDIVKHIETDIYPNKIRARAYIEDEINDMILVDRETLKYYDLIHKSFIKGDN